MPVRPGTLVSVYLETLTATVLLLFNWAVSVASQTAAALGHIPSSVMAIVMAVPGGVTALAVVTDMLVLAVVLSQLAFSLLAGTVTLLSLLKPSRYVAAAYGGVYGKIVLGLLAFGLVGGGTVLLVVFRPVQDVTDEAWCYAFRAESYVTYLGNVLAEWYDEVIPISNYLWAWVTDLAGEILEDFWSILLGALSIVMRLPTSTPSQLACIPANGGECLGWEDAQAFPCVPEQMYCLALDTVRFGVDDVLMRLAGAVLDLGGTATASTLTALRTVVWLIVDTFFVPWELLSGAAAPAGCLSAGACSQCSLARETGPRCCPTHGGVCIVKRWGSLGSFMQLLLELLKEIPILGDIIKIVSNLSALLIGFANDYIITPINFVLGIILTAFAAPINVFIKSLCAIVKLIDSFCVGCTGVGSGSYCGWKISKPNNVIPLLTGPIPGFGIAPTENFLGGLRRRMLWDAAGEVGGSGEAFSALVGGHEHLVSQWNAVTWDHHEVVVGAVHGALPSNRHERRRLKRERAWAETEKLEGGKRELGASSGRATRAHHPASTATAQRWHAPDVGVGADVGADVGVGAGGGVPFEGVAAGRGRSLAGAPPMEELAGGGGGRSLAEALPEEVLTGVASGLTTVLQKLARGSVYYSVRGTVMMLRWVLETLAPTLGLLEGGGETEPVGGSGGESFWQSLWDAFVDFWVWVWSIFEWVVGADDPANRWYDVMWGWLVGLPRRLLSFTLNFFLDTLCLFDGYGRVEEVNLDEAVREFDAWKDALVNEHLYSAVEQAFLLVRTVADTLLDWRFDALHGIVGLIYREALECSSASALHGITNPTGEWRLFCIFRLQLPYRMAEVFPILDLDEHIDWGTECLDGYTNVGFFETHVDALGNDVNCKCENLSYESCAEVYPSGPHLRSALISGFVEWVGALVQKVPGTGEPDFTIQDVIDLTIPLWIPIPGIMVDEVVRPVALFPLLEEFLLLGVNETTGRSLAARVFPSGATTPPGNAAVACVFVRLPADSWDLVISAAWFGLYLGSLAFLAGLTPAALAIAFFWLAFLAALVTAVARAYSRALADHERSQLIASVAVLEVPAAAATPSPPSKPASPTPLGGTGAHARGGPIHLETLRAPGTRGRWTTVTVPPEVPRREAGEGSSTWVVSREASRLAPTLWRPRASPSSTSGS